MKDKVIKKAEDTTSKITNKLAEKGSADIVIPKFTWMSGQCVKEADCGAAISEEDMKKQKVLPTVEGGDNKGYSWECAATTLAASIAVSAAIAYTM